MKIKILAVLSLVFIYGCEKEEATKANGADCQCYEVHEKYEPVNVNGMPQMQWVLGYQTEPSSMSCDSETEYYNANNTQRWKVICN
jgi:hypothetical protein